MQLGNDLIDTALIQYNTKKTRCERKEIERKEGDGWDEMSSHRNREKRERRMKRKRLKIIYGHLKLN